MYDAARHVLEASIASRLWNLAIMKPTRSKYISLLYDLNPNILVLFVLHECLQHTAVQRQITQKNITFLATPILSLAITHTESCYYLLTWGSHQF